MSDSHTKAVAVIERHDVEKMSPVVAASIAILRENPTPEALDKLYAVQERWEANEQRKKYADAMVGLKRELPAVLKHDKTVSFNSTHYTHTTMAAASEQVTPIMARHGFAVTFKPQTTEIGVAVTCQIRHAAGHVEEASLSSKIDVSNATIKNPIQQMASAVTYLKRYLFLSMLGIATADMPDVDDEPRDDAEAPDRIDTKRNQAAAARLSKYGKNIAQAQEFLGKTLAGWTVADLKKLEVWAKAPSPEAA